MGRLRYRARIVREGAGLDAARALRHQCFIDAAGLAPRPDGREGDGFDAACTHVLIEEAGTGVPRATFRLLFLPRGAMVGRSYAAQFYDLERLSCDPRPLAEVGRFCIRPGPRDADVLRVAWGAMARLVEGWGVGMLFGCSSFPGTDPARHAAAFAALAGGFVAPPSWAPARRAPETVPLCPHAAGADAAGAAAAAQGMRALPSLLRTYLAMGGRVSDHAVIDHDLRTLHVFTGVEVAQVPPARARALRQVAAAVTLEDEGLALRGGAD
ncbi:MAG: GNAT family N-acetyltransferase [Rubellimicrobium sp.]|nr:GNAT family N-acetyltransferase [Rubellimicrobium sp.]